MIGDAIRLAKEALIKPFEGYAKRLPDGSCKAYPDPGTGGHPWTIGYGSTGPDVIPGTVWPREKAEQRCEEHVRHFAVGVMKLSPRLMREPDRRLAAITSFAYNCGLGRYRISTLKKRVDAGDWQGAQEEIVKWTKANGRVMPGLVRRRAAEAAFLR